MKTVVMLVCAVISFILFEFTTFWGIMIALSYFPWSPFVYEPYGLQVFGWFLVAPALLICLVIRSVLRHYYQLNLIYLIMPIIIGFIFTMMISRSCITTWAIITSVSAGLAMILTLFIDIWCFRKRKVPEQKSEAEPSTPESKRLL